MLTIWHWRSRPWLAPDPAVPNAWQQVSRIRALTVPLLGLLLSFGVSAATLEGQPFEDVTRLASRELHLNGLGVRKFLFIKAYVAGLYLDGKAATSQEVDTLSGPKRLQLRMLRSAGPRDFNNALVAGIRDNSNASEQARLADRVRQLERTIRAIGSTAKGDLITLDYIPDDGTRLAVNGANFGSAIAGADFFKALLDIFVGEKPVDPQLKKGLLGQ